MGEARQRPGRGQALGTGIHGDKQIPCIKDITSDRTIQITAGTLRTYQGAGHEDEHNGDYC